MTEFKVGDKVRCIDILETTLEENKEYTISKIYTKYGNKGFIQIDEHSGSWFPTRFELMEETKPDVVFKVGQTYKTSTNFIVTITAVGVARLLAKSECGNEFAALITEAARLWTEYVKPIEVGSKVRFGGSELTVTAIHGDYAWVHTDNGSNYHGGPGGMIQRLDKLKVI